MTVSECRICGTAGAPWTASGDRLSIDCPICISYEITGTAAKTVSHWPVEKKLLLAGQVRRHWTDTQRAMRINSDTLEGVTGPRLVRVLDKLNSLLLDIAAHSPHPGAEVKISPMNCVVVDAKPGDELSYHIQSLIERKLLQAKTSINEVRITSDGWEYIDRLRNPTAGNRSDIFVAMSFSEKLRDAWEFGIRPGISAAGYRAKRVDSDAHNDKIDDRIIAGIRACYATVVDVTTQNAGAYFEAGFAMGLGRPVVWTVQRDDLPSLHFDTRQFNHIVWDDPRDFSIKLANHLLAVFGRGPVIAD